MGRCMAWMTSRRRKANASQMIAILTFLMAVLVHKQQKVLAQTYAPTSNTVNNIIEDYNPTDWYKRYPAYPPYCSIPSEMAKRQIPPLSDDARPGLTRLVHTSVIIRHGARTPADSNMVCWEGYHQDPAFVWNCSLTTLLGTPSPHDIAIEEGASSVDTSTATSALALFEKRYDALDDPADNINNYLNGTCQLGQLILRGYPQELTNGQNLRQAYVYNSNDPMGSHDIRMQLIDVANTTSGAPATVWDVSNLYYRVDDDQRTLMSGQILIRGLFGPEITQYATEQGRSPIMPLHVADMSRETMYPNHGICPRLSELYDQFVESSTFQMANESQEANTLRAFQQNVLKVNDMDAIDCLMTTICTDRPLPAAINDYRGPAVNSGGRRSTSSSGQTFAGSGNGGFGRRQQQDERLNLRLKREQQMNRLVETKRQEGQAEREALENTTFADSTDDGGLALPEPSQGEGVDGIGSTTEKSAATNTNNSTGTVTDYGTNLFQRLFDFDVKMETMIYTENDSEYSKLSMGPLWAEIMPNLQYAADRISKNEICCPPRPPSKLAIFSGHDTTLMPLLASLGPRVFDGTWPPYASMIAIEMHQVNLDGTKDKQLYPTDYAFRLVYNGQVITSRMDGCPEGADLCDAEILFTRLQPFATRARNCSRQDSIVEEYSGAASQAESALFSTPSGVLAIAMLTLGSAVAGALVTYFVLACRTDGSGGIPRHRGRNRRWRVSQKDEDDCDDEIEEAPQNGHHQYGEDDMNEEEGTFT